MVKRLFLLPFLFLLFFSQPSLAAEFTASVDRTKIGEQDTVTLKLRLNEQVYRGQPDLSVLEEDFRIQGQQRSQQLSFVNGKSESFTEWNIGLLPRRTGTLTIPALSFKGESTQPIIIEVLPPSAEAVEQAEKDFFFEVEVTPNNEALVQSQILYKEKLYYAADHNDANLSPFVVNNARVQQLSGVKNYTTVINGRRFGVYERNFAIFPESTGELVIPAQQFHANVPSAYDRWRRGQAINTTSEPINIKVTAIPANYPGAAVWLPASQLTLNESFSKAPSEWQAGEAVTRTISIEAQGIPGNQLPDISLTEVQHLRYYPDQTLHNENVSDNGVVGMAEQSVAIVASSGGEFTLPEVRIPWWNTQTNQLEYATLPSHSIKVAGAVVAVEKENDTAINQASGPEQPVAISSSEQANKQQWLLWLSLALLALSLAVNLFLLLTRKQQPMAVASTQPTDQDNKLLLKQNWRAFTEACSKNAAADIRQTLLAWVNAGGLANINLAVSSLSALAQQVENPDLANALLELDSTLYGEVSNADFNGQNLKLLVEDVAKKLNKTEEINKNNGLYPAI